MKRPRDEQVFGSNMIRLCNCRPCRLLNPASPSSPISLARNPVRDVDTQAINEWFRWSLRNIIYKEVNKRLKAGNVGDLLDTEHDAYEHGGLTRALNNESASQDLNGSATPKCELPLYTNNRSNVPIELPCASKRRNQTSVENKLNTPEDLSRDLVQDGMKHSCHDIIGNKESEAQRSINLENIARRTCLTQPSHDRSHKYGRAETMTLGVELAQAKTPNLIANHSTDIYINHRPENQTETLSAGPKNQNTDLIPTVHENSTPDTHTATPDTERLTMPPEIVSSPVFDSRIATPETSPITPRENKDQNYNQQQQQSDTAQNQYEVPGQDYTQLMFELLQRLQKQEAKISELQSQLDEKIKIKQHKSSEPEVYGTVIHDLAQIKTQLETNMYLWNDKAVAVKQLKADFQAQIEQLKDQLQHTRKNNMDLVQENLQLRRKFTCAKDLDHPSKAETHKEPHEMKPSDASVSKLAHLSSHLPVKNQVKFLADPCCIKNNSASLSQPLSKLAHLSSRLSVTTPHKISQLTKPVVSAFKDSYIHVHKVESKPMNNNKPYELLRSTHVFPSSSTSSWSLSDPEGYQKRLQKRYPNRHSLALVYQRNQRRRRVPAPLPGFYPHKAYPYPTLEDIFESSCAPVDEMKKSEKIFKSNSKTGRRVRFADDQPQEKRADQSPLSPDDQLQAHDKQPNQSSLSPENQLTTHEKQSNQNPVSEDKNEPNLSPLDGNINKKSPTLESDNIISEQEKGKDNICATDAIISLNPAMNGSDYAEMELLDSLKEKRNIEALAPIKSLLLPGRVHKKSIKNSVYSNIWN